MILRRLAQSIRKQDWLVIAIEFVIVVAGIFVGLQVTEWNEKRQLREREVSYLVRLAEDVAVMRAEIDEIRGRAEGRTEAAMRAFRALERCDAGLAEPEDFRRTLSRGVMSRGVMSRGVRSCSLHAAAGRPVRSG
ncbi:MAG: hypothetical protein CVV17_04485 [Gammaproteobacteria bacterium HGW-Gammaproteobacteria-7]|nr:MAG: hypothetical protein CVV17_04485 [Gammaproteobacteria bacterium HGW-Gammaproteobacteria-7]